MRPLAIFALTVTLAASPALAQVMLPETSRSESSATSINQNLMRQGEARGAAQQNQFEINSLRNARPAPLAPPVVAPQVVAPPIAGPRP